MLEPITSLLVFLGSAAINGVLGNHSDRRFTARWAQFKLNLTQHRPYANHELRRVVYRAYLMATLQSCAALLERKSLKIEAWFKSGTLPGRMANALRSLLREAPTGVFSIAEQQWLEDVSRDHIERLKLLDKEALDVPFEYEHEEFAKLLGELEVLMQPDEAKQRELAIGGALTNRLLKDLGREFGPPSVEFTALVNERWFEFLCAGFQFYVKHKQEIANLFESDLLAELVARSEWQNQFAELGGESLKRIESAQAWLLKEQHQSIEQIEALVTELLPLLSFAREETARIEILGSLIRAEAGRVIDVVQDEGQKSRAHVATYLSQLEAKIAERVSAPITEPQPIIHTLPTKHEIEGREEECASVLRAMSAGAHRMLVLAAPGGFGKTSLLAKVVKKISSDEKTVLERVTLQNDETVEPHIGALLHVDCRNCVKLSGLFADAGRLIGQEQTFHDIYNCDESLLDRLQKIFSHLSTSGTKRTWFVFDNFEPLLNDKSEISDAELREFFNSIFAGGHSVHTLIAAREVPKFSPRERFLELKDVGESLFNGLPIDDCVAYLKKNAATKGLRGSNEDVDRVLKEFTLKVHRIPLGLVWAIGYLQDTGFTLKELLNRKELFADFDQEQAKDADRYENKGLKRLHYEQLKIQSAERLLVLHLLAVFQCAVPKGALAHLLNEIDLNKTLTSLERNKLIARKDSGDGRTISDPTEMSLYSLHPVICENKFFQTSPANETLYETGATEIGTRALSAGNSQRFAYAVKLFECSEKLYGRLIHGLNRTDLLREYALTLMNKGAAFSGMTRWLEAVAEFENAIGVLKGLLKEEQEVHLAVDLAIAYLNKGGVLAFVTRSSEAIGDLDKAIAILEWLVKEADQKHLTGDLVAAHINKGINLALMTRSLEALDEFDKAIAILEPLVSVEHQMDLANDLAKAHISKGSALGSLTRVSESLAEYDKAIAILEPLRKDEPQVDVDLAKAHHARALELEKQQDWEGALASYEKALPAQMFCIEMGMYWITPDTLKTLRNCLVVSLKLRRWFRAAWAVQWILKLFARFCLNAAITQETKQIASKELFQTISYLRDMSNEERELLYVELGDDAERIRSYISIPSRFGV